MFGIIYELIKLPITILRVIIAFFNLLSRMISLQAESSAIVSGIGR